MNETENTLQTKKTLKDLVNDYKENNETKENVNINQTKPQSVIPTSPIGSNFNPEEFQNIMSQETDPDLIMTYEIVKLPSKGLFYPNRIDEVKVEYMTSKDEDLMTTPSLLESGKVMDVLLKRKVKSPEINVEDLLPGDRNAIILFLRTSSYGTDYKVEVTDPRTQRTFKQDVDLTKLEYKDMPEMPDEHGHFVVEIPMRKKIVKFRLLTHREDTDIFNKAESIKDAYGAEFSEYNTMKLKAHIVSINDNMDRTYINKFVDVMPALDAYTIRKKILEVQPDVDMKYEFTAPDGYKFKAEINVGIDFFFPNT